MYGYKTKFHRVRHLLGIHHFCYFESIVYKHRSEYDASVGRESKVSQVARYIALSKEYVSVRYVGIEIDRIGQERVVDGDKTYFCRLYLLSDSINILFRRFYGEDYEIYIHIRVLLELFFLLFIQSLHIAIGNFDSTVGNSKIGLHSIQHIYRIFRIVIGKLSLLSIGYQRLGKQCIIFFE